MIMWLLWFQQIVTCFQSNFSTFILRFLLSLSAIFYCEDASPSIQRWFGGEVDRPVGRVPDEEKWCDDEESKEGNCGKTKFIRQGDWREHGVFAKCCTQQDRQSEVEGERSLQEISGGNSHRERSGPCECESESLHTPLPAICGQRHQ